VGVVRHEATIMLSKLNYYFIPDIISLLIMPVGEIRIEISTLLLYSNLMNVYQLLSTEFFQAKVPCDRR
jgi:hypothetical protein